MACFEKLTQFFCGDFIDRQAELKAKVRFLEKRIKETEEVASAVSSSSATDELIDKFEKMMKDQKKEYVDQLTKVKEDCEAQVEEAKAQALLANAELEKSNLFIDEVRRGRSASEIETEGLGKEHSKIKQQLQDQSVALDEIRAIMDEDEKDDHDCFEHQRAYTQPWETLYAVLPLTDEEWNKDKDRLKKIRDQFYHPPTRKGKTFRNWQAALFRWAVRMVKTRWQLEEIGHQVADNCFDGFPSAAQIAEDNGPDLVKIMQEMVLEESPMVDWIEQEMQRLLPLVKRKKGVSPMMWLTALKDVFNKEKQVLGETCRNDQSRYNYIMTSLRLEPWARTAIRQTHNPKASNNMLNIRTQLRRLNIVNTDCYDDSGKELKNTHFEKNFIEELYSLFGSSLKAGEHNHTGEYNDFLSAAQGKSLYGLVCPPVVSEVNAGGPSHAPTTAPNDPLVNHDGLSFNAGGQKLTPEQLQQLRETPCSFGDKCRNLLTKGRCLRKHTAKEIAVCKKEFEKNHPEEAKKLEQWRKDRNAENKKKNDDAKAKKNAEQKASGGAAS
eukprot:g18291.t1